MRTFKEFTIGDTHYTLSFDRYTSVYQGQFTNSVIAYLRIFSDNPLHAEIQVRAFKNGGWTIKLGHYTTYIFDINKSKETKRMILNLLLNERNS